MIEVHIFRNGSDDPAATIMVDGGVCHINDPSGVIQTSMDVMSVRLRRPLSFDENREEWVRALPGSYRTHLQAATVAKDTHPITEEEIEQVRPSPR